MQNKSLRKNKAKEGNDDFEDMLRKFRPKNKANNSQKSTSANSSIRNSEENNNMVIEPNISSKNDDAKIINLEQVNLEQKNEKEDFFEDQKDSNEIKGEQYDFMECESEDEKMENEDNKEKRNDIPQNEDGNVNETPKDVKEIPIRFNNEIINSNINLDPREGNIGNNINNNNISHNIRPENTAKKNPIFKIIKSKKENDNIKNANSPVFYDSDFDGSLFSETQETIYNDDRLSLSEINLDMNRPFWNRGLSEALFANARLINNNTFGRNIAFYNDFNFFCIKETCCKSNFK